MYIYIVMYVIFLQGVLYPCILIKLNQDLLIRICQMVPTYIIFP